MVSFGEIHAPSFKTLPVGHLQEGVAPAVQVPPDVVHLLSSVIGGLV